MSGVTRMVQGHLQVSTDHVEQFLERLRRSVLVDRFLAAPDLAGEEIGLATVYRVLTQFEAAGLVQRHHFEGGHSVFELNRGGHHDHIVCIKCGRVEEFYDDIIEERQKAIAEEKGFTIEDHSLILYGSCRNPGCSGAD